MGDITVPVLIASLAAIAFFAHGVVKREIARVLTAAAAASIVAYVAIVLVPAHGSSAVAAVCVRLEQLGGGRVCSGAVAARAPDGTSRAIDVAAGGPLAGASPHRVQLRAEPVPGSRSLLVLSGDVVLGELSEAALAAAGTEWNGASRWPAGAEAREGVDLLDDAGAADDAEAAGQSEDAGASDAAPDEARGVIARASGGSASPGRSAQALSPSSPVVRDRRRVDEPRSADADTPSRDSVRASLPAEVLRPPAIRALRSAGARSATAASEQSVAPDSGLRTDPLAPRSSNTRPGIRAAPGPEALPQTSAAPKATPRPGKETRESAAIRESRTARELALRTEAANLGITSPCQAAVMLLDGVEPETVALSAALREACVRSLE